MQQVWQATGIDRGTEMNSIWIALITLHQPIGNVGIMNSIVGVGQFANQTRELCEVDGATAIAHIPKGIGALAEWRYTYECKELWINAK